VTPWDAAYLLHAELCRSAPNRYLQRVDAILPLSRLGHVVVMERLVPAPEDAAACLCAAIGLRGDTGWRPPDGLDLGGLDVDPDIVALRSQLAAVAAKGAATLPFWGGYDIRPGNVMADTAGALKLVDPFFIAGPKIIAAIVARDREALERLPEGALAAFFTIPPFASGAGELGEAATEMGLLGGVGSTAAGS
jgi:hypothetical protein